LTSRSKRIASTRGVAAEAAEHNARAATPARSARETTLFKT
jgi:hypothetical protein